MGEETGDELCWKVGLQPGTLVGGESKGCSVSLAEAEAGEAGQDLPNLFDGPAVVATIVCLGFEEAFHALGYPWVF